MHNKYNVVDDLSTHTKNKTYDDIMLFNYYNYSLVLSNSVLWDIGMYVIKLKINF